MLRILCLCFGSVLLKDIKKIIIMIQFTVTKQKNIYPFSNDINNIDLTKIPLLKNLEQAKR